MREKERERFESKSPRYKNTRHALSPGSLEKRESRSNFQRSPFFAVACTPGRLIGRAYRGIIAPLHKGDHARRRDATLTRFDASRGKTPSVRGASLSAGNVVRGVATRALPEIRVTRLELGTYFCIIRHFCSTLYTPRCVGLVYTVKLKSLLHRASISR